MPPMPEHEFIMQFIFEWISQFINRLPQLFDWSNPCIRLIDLIYLFNNLTVIKWKVFCLSWPNGVLSIQRRHLQMHPIEIHFEVSIQIILK